MRHSLAILITAACTDVPAGPPLECAPLVQTQHSFPTSGTVVDEIGGAPIAGVYVEALATDGVVLAATATDERGRYAMLPAASTTAVRRAFAPDYLDAVAYDPDVERANPVLPMLDRASADRLADLAGIERDRKRGMLLVIAQDCDGNGIAGAEISVAGAAAPLYLGNDTRFDPALTATSRNSAALVFDVPVGEVDASITVGDAAYTSFPVEIAADTLTTSWRRP